jgi:hypothetical protein
MRMQDAHRLEFTIPIFEPIPSQYVVRVEALDWMHAAAESLLSLQNIILPGAAAVHTELLDLEPLPRTALQSKQFEALYDGRFTHFNPIQTQAFHTLYHTDENILLGAPTGARQPRRDSGFARMARKGVWASVLDIGPCHGTARRTSARPSSAAWVGPSRAWEQAAVPAPCRVRQDGVK